MLIRSNKVEDLKFMLTQFLDGLKEQKLKAVQKIETGFLNAYYSPRTELGIKRFNKKRDELFN